MSPSEQKRALACAVRAARAAGALVRRNLGSAKKVNSSSQYDIKLELDVRSQKLIEKMLKADFPRVAFLGEEGVSGDAEANERWVVDPIDGTVNFAYGIPHAWHFDCAPNKKAKDFGEFQSSRPKSKAQSRRSQVISPSLARSMTRFVMKCGRRFAAARRG